MIELTNAYSYFASAILLLGWVLTNKNNDSKSIFGMGFFMAFFIYLGSSYFYFEDINELLEKLAIELFALAGASYILNKLKSSKLLNAIVFMLMILGFSQYVFHSERTRGSKIDTLSEESELILELSIHSNIETLKSISEKYNLEFKRAFTPNKKDITELDDYFLVDIPENSEYSVETILELLSDTKGVDWVEYNEVIDVSPVYKASEKDFKIQRKSRVDEIFNDQMVKDQWAFDILKMNTFNTLLKRIKPKKKVLLAILDTGIDSRHEDITVNYRSTNSQYDTDQRGHGTHCAGIAAGVTHNNIGIASFVPNNEWVNVTSIKVLNKSGGGTQDVIIKGIITATDNGADVISMSLGARSNLARERAYKQAIEYANKNGAIVVVAAGNSNQNANTFSPANTKMAITVSAIDQNKNKANFSNFFSDMKYAIAAPGVDILSTVPGNGYKTNSGTSMAAPHVAGLLAIMKAIKPDLNTEEAIHILKDTGFETSDTQRTGKLINPTGAIEMLVK